MITKGFSPSANRRVLRLLVRRRGLNQKPVSQESLCLDFQIPIYHLEDAHVTDSHMRTFLIREKKN